MSYQFHLSEATWQRSERYLASLKQGGQQPGYHLSQILQRQHLAEMDADDLLDNLVRTRVPMIFAESSIFGDGRDWNREELAILGDLGVSAEVNVFDNGRHRAPDIHDSPIKATLLFVPGALLRNDQGGEPADFAEVVIAGAIDTDGLTRLYERRLVPLLRYASDCALRAGRKALITMPGLGCGQFAGPFRGQMGEHLRHSLIRILTQHAAVLPAIRMIYFDPYDECQTTTHTLGHLELRVRPLLQIPAARPQLCTPRQYEEHGDDFADCMLFSFVAWDHVSWPGNDFYGGSRTTDDGVKAAATDVMRVITGIEGCYDPGSHRYQPPDGFRHWGQVVADHGLRLQRTACARSS